MTNKKIYGIRFLTHLIIKLRNWNLAFPAFFECCNTKDMGSAKHAAKIPGLHVFCRIFHAIIPVLPLQKSRK